MCLILAVLEYIKRFCKECDAQEADDLKFWDLRYWINAVRDVSCTINEVRSFSMCIHIHLHFLFHVGLKLRYNPSSISQIVSYI